MKKFTFYLTILIVAFSFFINEIKAQAPQSFLYQAEARDSHGKILVEDMLSVKVTILRESSEVYREKHTVQTDLNGLFNVRVGEGDEPEGDFSNIDWSTGSYFLNIQIAAGNSANYKNMGTTQLLSVPYAFHAETVSNVDDADADPTNELQSLSISNNSLTISGANSVLLPTGNIKIWSGYVPHNIYGPGWKVYYPNTNEFNTLENYISYNDNDGTFTINETGFYRINFKARTNTDFYSSFCRITLNGYQLNQGSACSGSNHPNDIYMDFIWRFQIGDRFKIEVCVLAYYDVACYG